MALPIALGALLWGVVSWIFRAVVIRAVIFMALFAMLSLFVPWAIELLAPHIGSGSLSGAFGYFSPEMWWFLDFFRLDIGIPLLISAAVSAFLIRRIPMIG